MTLKILYTKINGTLTQDISAASTLIPIDVDSFSILQANVNFGAGEWTYLTLDNDIYTEEIKVIGLSVTNLSVVRATSGSVAKAFSALNTTIHDSFGADAIKDIIAASPVTSSVTLSGQGIAEVTSVGQSYTIKVPAPEFSGTDGVAITGQWPNLSFAYEGSGSGCCCGGGGSSGSTGGVDTVVVESAILQAGIAANVLTLTLPSPTFTGVGGVTVSGSWGAGYTISGSGGGGTGTVTAVSVGAGLTLSGTPSVNPTISITNTGVTAGTYGDITINARGQITSITPGFSPTGDIILNNGGTAVRVGSTYAITLDEAAVGRKGIVALADSTAFNPADDSTALTPAGFTAALAGRGAAIAGTGSSIGEADALYNNILSGSAVTVSLTSSQKMIIMAECEVVDGTSPLTPVAYGISLFTAANVRLYSSKIITQNKQSILAFIGGPLASTAISLVTTALPSGSSVNSQNLATIIV